MSDSDDPRCLDEGRSACSGAVAYRLSLSGTGRNFPRCESHWESRLQEHERHMTTYPDAPNPPSWFDPAAAGERWDSDY